MKADFDFPSPYWDEISADAKDFISKLLVVDSKKRATSKQALDHKWIVNIFRENSLTHFFRKELPVPRL
jgi:serine/threonine protein kinase